MVTIFGDVAADVLLQQIEASTRSNSRYVIDFRSPDEQKAIFESLMRRTGRVIEIWIDDERHSLRAVDLDTVDVVPVLVASKDEAGKHDNVMTDGWASRLRDVYTEGADAYRPRVLLTFTEESNETQRSASEGTVDRGLLSMPAMVCRLHERRRIADDDPRRQALDICLQRADSREPAGELLARMDRFLAETHEMGADARGEALGRLGCFFPDGRPEWSDALHENADTFGQIRGFFDDPFANARQKIGDTFEDESARAIADAGAGRLATIDFASLHKRPREQARDKNEIVRDHIRVTGAAHHLLLEDADEPVLVIASKAAVTIELGLARELGAKEYVHLVGWDGRKGKPHAEKKRVRTLAGGRVAITIPEPAKFAVWRVMLSRGPRSFAKYDDHLWVAVYETAAPWLAYESDCRLSLEHQAWEQKSLEACFEVSSRDGSASSVHKRRGEGHAPEGLSEDEAGSEDGLLSGDEEVSWVALEGEGEPLHTRVYWLGKAEEEEDTDDLLDWLEQAVYRTQSLEVRARLTAALQSQRPHLAAIEHVKRSADAWEVTLSGSLRLRIKPWNEHGEEEAVGRLLEAPEVQRLERRGKDGEFVWQPHVFSPDVREHLEGLIQARQSLFEVLRDAARARHRTRRGSDDVADMPLGLVDLQAHREEIEVYLDAWRSAYEAVTPEMTRFSEVHRALLDLDTLKEIDPERKALQRLTVLPTHPWLLWAMLRYQEIAGSELARMSNSQKFRFHLHLTRDEAEQLVHPVPVDDWYDGPDGKVHLCRIDGPPFHWSFIPRDSFRQRGGLGYVARVVRHKMERYLRIHRHLDHESRTLRVGFVNPGNGDQLLEGIRDWVRARSKAKQSSASEGAGAGSARIPDIEVLLFSTGNAQEQSLGAAFDAFFTHGFTTEADETTRILLSKLRYLQLHRKAPETERDYVHLCFISGLVREEEFRDRDCEIEDGWDGCFGDGLLATSLRSSRKEEASWRTERGLWIADAGTRPGRSGLAQIAALLRGCSGGTVDPALGRCWGAGVPRLGELRTMYNHADWIVHLDRALGLEVFRELEKQGDEHGGSGSAPPRVIEYSDQEEPDTPGYDTITVTSHAQPYLDQLAKVLEFAGLPIPRDSEAERRCAYGLLGNINAISGSWALDFIEGNMSQDSWSTRLKGHVGVALVYRWLWRVEADALRKHYGKAVVPVYLSLEEIMRATPSAELPIKDGMTSRARNDGITGSRGQALQAFCDDLLALYLTFSDDGQVRMVGRVIEVKLGVRPTQYIDKAVAQVQGTQKILSTYLSGDHERGDAVFRSKQLSLLLKSRIEQFLATDSVEAQALADLDRRRLSAALASGNWQVDYMIGANGRHLRGDVFLLCTDVSEVERGKVAITERDGVRILEMTKSTLEWLAFQPEDAFTMPGPPTDTLPHLGRYDGAITRAAQVAGTGAVPALRSWGDEDVAGEDEPLGPMAGDRRTGPEGVSSEVSPGDVAVGSTIDPSPDPVPGPVVAVADRSGMDEPGMSLEDACRSPVKIPSIDRTRVAEVVGRLERALQGHKVALEVPPSVEEARIGPRLVRVHVRLRPGESIQGVRRISEDLARDVGTQSPDVHVCNVPELHAIGIDLPIQGLSYEVDYQDLMQHASFEAAKRELALGICAGIDVTGNALWVDLATMPHALVAGTTGSGKTVFLRQLLLTLLLHRSPADMQIRLSSSKPMDFRLFERVPHAGGTRVASDPQQSLALARDLVAEMDRRIDLISEAACDNLAEYNQECSPVHRLPYLVAVIDEFAETVLAFDNKNERAEFEKSIARLAQKSRAAGIHMVLCMQRPDSAVIQGPIKANILHRFALKLPQNHDSRVILDEAGAEALLGQGDLLYKDASGRLFRLQVPNLEKRVLKECLADAES